MSVPQHRGQCVWAKGVRRMRWKMEADFDSVIYNILAKLIYGWKDKNVQCREIKLRSIWTLILVSWNYISIMKLLNRHFSIHTYIHRLRYDTTLGGSWDPTQHFSISHDREHPTYSFVCPVLLDRSLVRLSTSAGIFLSFGSRTWRPVRWFWGAGCPPSFQDVWPIVCG